MFNCDEFESFVFLQTLFLENIIKKRENTCYLDCFHTIIKVLHNIKKINDFFLGKRDARRHRVYLWTDRTVPYEIAPELGIDSK